MVRTGRAKIFFIFLLTLVMASLVVALVFASAEERTERAFFSDPPEYASHTITLSTEDWTRSTFVNASEFEEVTFDGADAWYYELATSMETQYSMTASLTSPYLSVYDRDYTLGFSFFTRQRSSTPNRLTVLTSSDGVTYAENDSFECADSGSELENWRTGELSVWGDSHYIRLLFTVYYSGEGGERLEDSGLYLNKEIKLTASASGGLSSSDLGVTFEDEVFYYNGEEQRPEYTIRDTASAPHYYVEEVLRDGDPAVPVDAGDYTLRITFYDDANNFILSARKEYTIQKQTIDYLDTFEAVSNNNYIVVLEATFIDKTGRAISLAEAGCSRIYRATSTLVLNVGGKNFNAFVARKSIVPNASTSYLPYMEGKDVTATYTGNGQSLLSHITFFREYNFETGEFTTVLAATVPVTYYQDGEVLEGAPKNAGAYSYVMEYGSGRFEGTYTIRPKTIATARYTGSEEIDKYYDGTTALSVGGVIVDAFDPATVASDDVATGDDVVIQMGKTEYARELGSTYLVGRKTSLSGEDADNYVSADVIYMAETAHVVPTTLHWDLKDKNGSSVRFADKTYDGTTALQIVNSENVELALTGVGKGKVTFGDISASTLSASSGEQTVRFTLTDASLFDKFTSAILTETSATVSIHPYALTASAGTYDRVTKTYDGTKTIRPSITSLTIRVEDMPIIDDGFAAAFASEEYELEYAEAQFDRADAGNRTIAVTEIVFRAFDKQKQAILSNYHVERVVLNGRIEPKSIVVLTENLRIYTGQALPDVETTTEDEDVITTTVYATSEDAEGMINPLGDTTTISSTGDYFVRVGCSSANYLLTGNVILPLAITTAEEREDQYIRISAYDQTLPFVRVPYLGTLKLGAESFTSDGKRTGRPVTVTTYSGRCGISGDVITVTDYADFAVTLSAEGNSFYRNAQNVTLRFAVVEADVVCSGVSPSGLYMGDELPDGDVLRTTKTFTRNGTPIQGTIVSRGGQLSQGENTYSYGFIPETEYSEVEPGESISTQIYYTFDGDEYVEVPVGTTLDENETYYQGQRAFYGETTVEVTLTAGKRDVQVVLNGSYSLQFGNALPLESAITSVYVDGERQTIAEIAALCQSVELHRITATGYEDETQTMFGPGTYTVHGEGALDRLTVVIDAEEKYAVTITGSATFVVNKSEITVYTRSTRKYYRSSNGASETELKGLLEIEGSYDPSDRDDVLSEVTVVNAAAGKAGVGDYNVVPTGPAETDKYVITYRNGYYSVVPTPVTIFANPVGHVYGEAVNSIQAGVSLGVSSGFSDEAAEDVRNVLRRNLLAWTDASSRSDVGSYAIYFDYVGGDTNFVITFSDSYYSVLPATITGVRFYGNSVLYDGERHTLAVTFEEEDEEITVRYNHDYFVDVGIYDYRAVISKPNYSDLILTARLTIGTLTLTGSRIGENAVSITFSQENHSTGLTPNLIPELISTGYDQMEENAKADLDKKISSVLKDKGYDVKGIYSVVVYDGSSMQRFEDDAYEISFTPADTKYSSSLVLLGYGEDGTYQKLDYTYANGTYRVKTSSLSDLVFVTEKATEIDHTFIWIGVVIAGVIMLLAFAVLFSGRSKRKRQKARSIRRHRRWA